MFYIGLYRENMKKIFLSETTRPRAMIFRLWHYPVDATKVVQIMPWGLKMGLPRGSNVLHWLIKENYGKNLLV